MLHPNITRRRLLLGAMALPLGTLLQGCRASLPPLSVATTPSDARKLLLDSANAQGLAAYLNFNDVNVSYAGKWHSLVGKLQPTLVDAGYRGTSQERMLVRAAIVGQAFEGKSGHKQVSRHVQAAAQGDVSVWFNGDEAHDAERRAAAALVVDGYELFLFGPMLLAKFLDAGRPMVMQLTGSEILMQQKHSYPCDVLRIRMQPGIGFSAADDLALYIDRERRLMRRLRFSLEGLESTRGALAQVDMFEHLMHNGVWWPTRFREDLLRPLPLPVHEWSLTGLDVDRNLHAAEISGPAFAGAAVAPAAALPR